jgi:serine/threonine protein phosphatase 1
MSKFIAVGDVHGRYDLLSQLLTKIEATEKDFTYVFLGDMIDRGPDSFKVVDTIKKLTEKGHIALLGNHEDMALQYYRNKVVDRNDIWQYNGGDKTIRSYGDEAKAYGQANFFKIFDTCGHAQWIKDLPINHETPEVWFSHAPIPKDKYRRSLGDFRMDKFANTWSFHGECGTDEYEFVKDLGKLAVCGHVHAVNEGKFVPRAYPSSQGDYDKIVYVDTGCGCWHTAPLSAIVIEDGKVGKVIQAWPEQ